LSLSILSSIASLRAQRKLAETGRELEKTLERLASGQRIHRAGDDAAGLAVSTLLKRDERVERTAIRNANDGISLVSIGDSALGEIANILQRMAELAEQAANDIITTRQRSPLQQEFDALGSEIERIARTTTFNGLNVISDGLRVAVQVGLNGQADSRYTIGGVQGTLNSLSLTNQGSDALSYSINGATQIEAQAAARTALDAVLAAMTEVSFRRGSLGADESRLSSSLQTLTSARENYIAANSRIEDVDVATETANLVRLQILQNVQTAILAQANQQPAIVLRLIEATRGTES
jgi:flagellin